MTRRGASRICLVWLGMVAGAACAGSGPARGSEDQRPADRESTRAELMAAARAFAADSRARGAPLESGTWWEDAGWTSGPWWISPPSGGEPADSGRYLTAWIREDGRWKVALDVSVPDCLTVPDARQFDFWTGDWKVAQRIRDGAGWEEYPGRSSVRPVADGCLLVERWDGTVRFPWEGMDEPSAMRGGSVRYLDLDSGTWRIHWIDDRSNSFGPPFVGGFEGARGVFVRDGARPARIIFDRRGAGGVEWRLETPVNDDWLPIWTMMFTR